MRLLVFLDEHNGSVAAFAGVMVGLFTLALWKSTDKLWSESRQQRMDVRKGGAASVVAARAALRSSRAAEKSANTAEKALTSLEGPMIAPHRMEFAYDDRGGAISFCFRNFGRSAATIRKVSAVAFITPANTPTNIQARKERPFMFEEIVAENEISEKLVFVDDIFRQYGRAIDEAQVDLHLLVNYEWRGLLERIEGGGQRFIWNPKRRRFLAGIQLWDDPERFPPGTTRRP